MGKINTAEEQEKANMVLQLFERERSKRGNWETHWQEIAERYWPQQSRLFVGQKDSGIQGEKRNEYIFDSTPVMSLNRFGAIVDSLLTPRNTTWHRLAPVDDIALTNDRNIQLYFDQVNRILFRQRYSPKANFASQNQLTYKMLGAYGNSALYIDALKGKGEKGLRYKNVHLCEIWFLENHQGIVDTAIRESRVFPRQIIQWFGIENTPDAVVEMAKAGEKDAWIYLYHCVKPREDVDFGRRDARGKRFASYYVIGGQTMRHLLEEGGYDCFPYAISRYEQVPNEVYGRSPAMDCLPATKTLNEEKKAMLKQGHRTVDPVLLAHDDGVLDNFSLTPGAINPGGVTADGRPLIHTLPIGNVQAGKEMMDDERDLIKSSFLVDLFQILEETPEMTATEVLERIKEKGILLTPVLGRQESEYLGPMVERELSILTNLHLLPPAPKRLKDAGGEYQLVYDSPLSRSQKAESAAGLMRTVENCIQVAQQAQDPSMLDYFNWDAIIPEYSEINAVPARWLNSSEKIKQIRANRQQQQQREQQVREMPGRAAMIKAVSKAHEQAPDQTEQALQGNQQQQAVGQ
jgi:Bacteriophage head to tail connecting protein